MNQIRRLARAGGKGFTLIELMIVMVIIGSVIALAVPRIGKSMEKMRLRSASRKLSAVLRYTRQMAISRKKEYAVTFNDHSYTYVNVVRKTVENSEQTPVQTAGEDAASGTSSGSSGSSGKNLSEKGIDEKSVQVDLHKEMKTEDISLSYQKEGEDEDTYHEPDKESEIIFYPKGESSGGKVILALKEPVMAFQIEVDPITGRVTVKRKTENE
jgi:type II secretion system protein H